MFQCPWNLTDSNVFTIQLDFLCLYVFTCPSAQPIGELRMKSVGARTSTKATASSFSCERDRADFTVRPSHHFFNVLLFHEDIPKVQESTSKALLDHTSQCITTWSKRWMESLWGHRQILKLWDFLLSLCLEIKCCESQIWLRPRIRPSPVDTLIKMWIRPEAYQSFDFHGTKIVKCQV